MAVPEKILQRIEQLRRRAEGASPELATEISWLADAYLKLERNLEKLSRVSDRMQAQILALNERLAAAAVTDPQTGLANRRGIVQRLAALWSAADAADFVLVLADIDRFKAINDSHGHDVGDTVLAEVAARLSAVLGPRDFLGRWGGEEFLALLAAPGHAEAEDRIAVLHDALRAAPVITAAGPLAVRISSGAIRYRPGLSVEHALMHADRALYAAKDAGRDCSCWSDELAEA